LSRIYIFSGGVIEYVLKYTLLPGNCMVDACLVYDYDEQIWLRHHNCALCSFVSGKLKEWQRSFPVKEATGTTLL